jgi:hypothetical protein
MNVCSPPFTAATRSNLIRAAVDKQLWHATHFTTINLQICNPKLLCWQPMQQSNKGQCVFATSHCIVHAMHECAAATPTPISACSIMLKSHPCSRHNQLAVQIAVGLADKPQTGPPTHP